MAFATFSYPGVNGDYDSFDFTDLVGVSPAVGTLTYILRPGVTPNLAPNGNILINYDDGTQIVIQFAHIDNVAFHQDGGGQIATIRFLDERWAWQFAYITGNYNIRFPSGLIDPAHQKTPQQLAIMLFQAVGAVQFDVSLLPNDARPPCDWDNASAAAELEKLVNDLGCRIVCQRSTGIWRIVVTGVGQDLPDLSGGNVEVNGIGINPKETPDYLRVVTAPFRFQCCFRLLPSARDLDQSWQFLKDVKYNPRLGNAQYATPDSNSGQPPDACAEFGRDDVMMSNISWTRLLQPDGTFKSPREFALESAFKMWRPTASSNPRFPLAPGFIPGYQNDATLDQIIFSGELVESYTDFLGVDHKRPAYIFGEYFQTKRMPPNTPPGTRIDRQGEQFTSGLEEPANFSIAIDELYPQRTIITTSRRMMTRYNVQFGPCSSGVGNCWPSAFGAANLFYTCAVQVRDPITWQPVRYEKLLHIGNGTNKNFCQTILQEDITPWTIQTYNANGGIDASSGYVNFTQNMPGNSLINGQGNRNNYADVNQQCDYYLNSYALTFQIVATKTRQYIGILPIDMDGAICQVQWKLDSRGGSTTIASLGTEHNYNIPTYEDRLQRNATQSQAAKLAYSQYRGYRRQLLLGTNNTI